MDSLHDSSIAHWSRERRRLARSPGFSRPDVLPPEGGTPCMSRFMERFAESAVGRDSFTARRVNVEEPWNCVSPGPIGRFAMRQTHAFCAFFSSPRRMDGPKPGVYATSTVWH